MVKLDMHLHSWFSDGKLSPEELVLKCKEAGLEFIAVTDHDNTGAIREALEAGRRLGVKVIPGAEFSVNDCDGHEQHILGYCFDWQSRALDDFFESWKATKVAQLEAMTQKLRDVCLQITAEQVIAPAKGSFNRAHIGYAVFEQPDNVALLKERYGIKEVHDFFRMFLKEGAEQSVYVPKTRPPVKDVLRLVLELGGISVWTHPFWQGQTISDITMKASVFKSMGLDGIETLYSRIFHSRDKAIALHCLARAMNLYETAGSDFHSFRMGMYNKIGDFETFGIELNLPPCFI